MKVQINRIHFAEIDNIDRIVETQSDVRVYLKSGFPLCLKTNCTKSALLIRMVNACVKSDKIKELRDQ